MDEQFTKVEVKKNSLYINGIKMKGVEKFKVTLSSDIPKGKAELEMKAIVEFPDNRQERNLLQAEKGSE